CEDLFFRHCHHQPSELAFSAATIGMSTRRSMRRSMPRPVDGPAPAMTYWKIGIDGIRPRDAGNS
ncbi:MAG: hypothetical protein WB036_21190, partial [Pseudolabrys sp.]